MNAHPGSILTPVAEIGVNGLPVGEVCWQVAPSAPLRQDVENGVEYRPNLDRAGRPPSFAGESRTQSVPTALESGCWSMLYSSLSMVLYISIYSVCLESFLRDSYLFKRPLSQRLEKGHHRIENRKVYTVPVSQLTALHEQDTWAGLTTVVMVVRSIQHWNKTTHEVILHH
jgi:hypothetical protein